MIDRDVLAQAYELQRAVWGDDHPLLVATRLLLDFPTEIRQGVFDVVMQRWGMDDSDMDDQAEASEFTDEIVEAVRQAIFTSS